MTHQAPKCSARRSIRVCAEQNQKRFIGWTTRGEVDTWAPHIFYHQESMLDTLHLEWSKKERWAWLLHRAIPFQCCATSRDLTEMHSLSTPSGRHSLSTPSGRQIDRLSKDLPSHLYDMIVVLRLTNYWEQLLLLAALSGVPMSPGSCQFEYPGMTGPVLAPPTWAPRLQLPVPCTTWDYPTQKAWPQAVEWGVSNIR